MPVDFYRLTDKGLFISVYVQPRASKDQIVGLYQDRLKIRLRAPPVDNQANEELMVFLAKAFGISKSSLRVVKGLTSRQKSLLVTNVDYDRMVSQLLKWTSI